MSRSAYAPAPVQVEQPQLQRPYAMQQQQSSSLMSPEASAWSPPPAGNHSITGGVDSRALLASPAATANGNGHSFNNYGPPRGGEHQQHPPPHHPQQLYHHHQYQPFSPVPFVYQSYSHPQFQEQLLQQPHGGAVTMQPPPLHTTAASFPQQSSQSTNGYTSIPLDSSPAKSGAYAHKGFHFASTAPPSAAASASAASPIIAAAANAPFHSYPHIQFRLPDSFSEEAEAIWAPVAPVVVVPAPPESEPEPESQQQKQSLPTQPYVPSLANAPFQSLLPVGSTATVGDGSSSPLPRPPPACATTVSPSKKPAAPARPRRRFHLSFRAMHRSDVARVARMHEQLFPVRYDDRFYASLLSVHAVTLLAFLECDDDKEGGDAVAAAARVPGSGNSDRSDLLQTAANGVVNADPSSSSSSERHRLILVGLATGRCREESSTCRRSHSGYITTLGVDSRFRRLGLGKFLIKHLVRLLRELDPRIEQVTLDVLESNDAAVSLYKSAGFKVLQRLEEHYQFPPPNDTRLHHALQMVKYLDKRKSIYDDDDDRDGEQGRKQGWGCAIM